MGPIEVRWSGTHSNVHFRNEKNVSAAKFLNHCLSQNCTFLFELFKEPGTTKSTAIDVRIILACYNLTFLQPLLNQRDWMLDGEVHSLPLPTKKIA